MWRFLKKLEIELPYDPAIPLLGIHTEETRIEGDTCTPMFIAALFIISRTWKQPRCPSADEWIRRGRGSRQSRRPHPAGRASVGTRAETQAGTDTELLQVSRLRDRSQTSSAEAGGQ